MMGKPPLQRFFIVAFAFGVMIDFVRAGLYFQYYSRLYYMPADFDYDIDNTTEYRKKVVVEYEQGEGSNCGIYQTGGTQFAGPISNTDSTKLYILGRTCNGGCDNTVCSDTALIELDVSQGVDQIQARVLYSGTTGISKFVADAAAGWDPVLNAVFWCYGDYSDFGKCFNFVPDTDSEPQRWGSAGVGNRVVVNSGVRGPAVIGELQDGGKYLFLTGKSGVYRHSLSGGDGPSGTPVQLVNQNQHVPTGGAYDTDQFGYGLYLWQEDGSSAEELWYTSRLRGIIRISSPHNATLDSGVPRLAIFSYQMYRYFFGLAIHPAERRFYTATRPWWAGGEIVGCKMATVNWLRGDFKWLNNASRDNSRYCENFFPVTNCDLSTATSNDYEANAWMVFAGPEISQPLVEDPDSIPSRGPNVSAPLMLYGVYGYLQGMIMHATATKSGNTYYNYVDQTHDIHIKIFECFDGGGGARSGVVFDRDYGWLYVVCQFKLMRLNLAGLLKAGYGVSMSHVYVNNFDYLYPGHVPDLVEVIYDHDTVKWAENPGYGFFIYTHNYVYGSALGLDRNKGYLYWTTRHYKADVYPVADLGVWVWRLGIDSGWLPLAMIPDTPGGNQAGRFQFDNSGNMFLAISNQVVDETNGIYMITNLWDMLGGTQTVRQVYQQGWGNTMAAWAIHFDEVTDEPAWLWTAAHNETYTAYSLDMSSLVRIPWVGNLDQGEFDASQYVYLDNVYHRGTCLFGCAIWTLLAIIEDPTTGLLWTTYYNGDADHYVLPYDPATGLFDESCYFYTASSAVTHPKHAELLHYGARPGSSCRCPNRNGKAAGSANFGYYLPGFTSVGYCSPTVWFWPLYPGADLLGDCAIENCTSCSPFSNSPSCSGFLPQCALSCCNSGYSNGNYWFMGHDDSIDRIRQSYCLADKTSIVPDFDNITQNTSSPTTFPTLSSSPTAFPTLSSSPTSPTAFPTLSSSPTSPTESPTSLSPTSSPTGDICTPTSITCYYVDLEVSETEVSQTELDVMIAGSDNAAQYIYVFLSAKNFNCDTPTLSFEYQTTWSSTREILVYEGDYASTSDAVHISTCGKGETGGACRDFLECFNDVPLSYNTIELGDSKLLSISKPYATGASCSSPSRVMQGKLTFTCQAAPAPTASPPTAFPTTASPTTASPTTASPTTASPASPTTASPTTASPTTASPTTASPTTPSPTTASPTTASPTAPSSITESPTTVSSITESPTAASSTTESPTAASSITESPTAASSITESPTAASSITESPTAASSITESPTAASSITESPTAASSITESPTAASPTASSKKKIHSTTSTPTAASSTTASPAASPTFSFSSHADHSLNVSISILIGSILLRMCFNSIY